MSRNDRNILKIDIMITFYYGGPRNAECAISNIKLKSYNENI